MSEPNWELLPYEPNEFFELSGEFDRKDLKRAYNRWIRIYKPERFPAEFQRIRAAFEQLDGELRYGRAAGVATTPNQEYAWKGQGSGQAGPAATGSVEEAAPAKRKRVEPSIRDRLKTEPAATVYKTLRDKRDKTPYEYFVLATLADVVTQDANLYFKWLLTGLKEHGNDPGLFQLLQQFFGRDHKPGLLRSLLKTASKVVNNDLFYRLTEKSWFRLLRMVDFRTFKSVLAGCEENLRDHQNQAQLVFYCELLKAAIWVGDRQWLAEKFSIVDGAIGEAGGRMESELHMIDLLKDYFGHAREIVEANAICKRIHEAIRAYFMLDEPQADLAIVECQNDLVSDAQALLDAFPENNEAVMALGILWMMVNEDVSERHGLKVGVQGTTRLDQKVFVDRVRGLLVDLDDTWHFGAKQLLTLYAARWGSYLLMVLGPIALLYSWLGRTDMMVLCGGLIVGGILLNYFYLMPRTIMPKFSEYIDRVVAGAYRRQWRGRFVQLFDATGATMADLVPVLVNIVQTDNRLSTSTSWIPEHVSEDIGLAFYSLAARYRR